MHMGAEQESKRFRTRPTDWEINAITTFSSLHQEELQSSRLGHVHEEQHA